MASVGDILREKRIEQRRSIEDVAETTKIRTNIIQSIEHNELEILPLPYIKSFVKTYAKLLGVSDREEIRTFLASQASQPSKVYRTTPPTPGADTAPKPVIVQRTKQEASVASDDTPRPERPVAPVRVSQVPVNMLVYIGLALGSLALLYYFVFSTDDTTETAEQLPPATAPVEVGTTDSPTPVAGTPAPDSAALSAEAIPEQDSLILEAHTTARVWISIVSDGMRSSQMTLEPENTYRWSADSIFTLSLGNAGGVRFTLNGQPLQSLGKAGAIVRNVRITRKGVVSSSSPYTSSVQQRPTASTQRRQSNRTSERRIPLITPAETRSPTPTIPPPEQRLPVNNR